MAPFILEHRQRTHDGNYNLREEYEPWFLHILKSIYTEVPHDKYELRDGKGRVAAWRVNETLTRVAVMITFL
jgi:hypothetical protein